MFTKHHAESDLGSDTAVEKKIHQSLFKAAVLKLCTHTGRMSVGFIGAGQVAHALVRGFTAAGEL